MLILCSVPIHLTKHPNNHPNLTASTLPVNVRRNIRNVVQDTYYKPESFPVGLTFGLTNMSLSRLNLDFIMLHISNTCQNIILKLYDVRGMFIKAICSMCNICQ